MNAAWSAERTEHLPMSDEHHTVNLQEAECPCIPGQCFHLLEVRRRTTAAHTDCTTTTVKSQLIIVVEEMVLLVGPYGLLGSQDPAWQT